MIYLKFKKFFTWHFFPRHDELTIKSFLETVFYILIFTGCGFLFKEWNNVPVRRDNFRIECLARPVQDIHTDIAPIAKITYCVPMTSTDWKSPSTVELWRLNQKTDPNSSKETINSIYHEKGLLRIVRSIVEPGLTIDFSQWTTQKHKDKATGLIFSDPYLDSLFVDSIKRKEQSKSIFWQSLFDDNKDYPYSYSVNTLLDIYDKRELGNEYWDIVSKRLFLWERNNYDNSAFEFDSLKNNFTQSIPDSLKENDPNFYQPLYYCKYISNRFHTLRPLWHILKNYNQDYTYKYADKGYRHFRQIHTKEQITDVCFRSGLSPNSIHFQGSNSIFADSPIQSPGWLRLEDISQAYYDINLESLTIDSIILKFDFIGATEFSLMQPEPDNITMSSIEFSDPYKILEIKLNGLKFHAKFIELEKRQEIRVFFVTAIMSALITLFFGLLFYFIIKLIKRYQEPQT